MYALNQMNSLYFFPHRISFEPLPRDARGARLRWPPPGERSTSGLAGDEPRDEETGRMRADRKT
jgi:hypothetical protein